MKFFPILFLLFISQVSYSQFTNWYDEDAGLNGPFSISSNKAHTELMRNKKAKEVVVAIIDSGVDAEHEDLKNVMWVNEDEIPGNGIDDDKNGYVDDVHGWNFIGNINGDNVAQDTYEMTRLFGELQKKFKNITSAVQVDKEDLDDYQQYLEWEKTINKERNSAKKQLDEFEKTERYLLDIVDALDDYIVTDTITQETIADLEMSGDPQLMVAGNILNSVKDQYGEIPTLSQLRDDIVFQFSQVKAEAHSKYNFHYNPEFDSRKIVGDNFDDVDERGYGNNDVEGPDAFHGTHVAGIVGAERNNDIGMNGIADNVKIMSVRAVPDGDERDKDVANAIIYAVDNGAKVINMSFGKGYSPRKEAVDKAVRYAEKNDVLLVHASGNSSANNDSEPNFPNDTYRKGIGFLFFKKKQPKNWIEVGALNNSDDESMVASFSNYGKKEVDVFAPGMYMFAPVPDDNYQILQGTSMAAPVVSGIAAVIRGYFPELKAKEVKEVIMNSTITTDQEVIVPGTDDKIPFSELSVSGGAVNLYSAFKYANAKVNGISPKGSKTRSGSKDNKTSGKKKTNITAP